MMIIGVDYHPSFQTIAFLIEETGECDEQELNHSDGQAEKFYRDLKQRGIGVRVGMEATGYARWFERLLAELGFELWIGDPAEIKAKRVRKQKTDREDARLMRKLLLENRFPRIWVPDPENLGSGSGRGPALFFDKKAIGYCGLCGAEKSSGGIVQRSPLSKQRNKHLQTTLIEAAKMAPRYSPDLAMLYDREKQKGNANRATLAVARKLVTYLMAIDRGQRNFQVATRNIAA